MENICFLLVFQDVLFKQILANLLIEMDSRFEIYESAAVDVEGLRNEISNLKPDTILLEEASPFSVPPGLGDLLMAMPGKPIIVVSQQYNLMHVVHYRRVQVETVGALVEVLRNF